MNDAREWLEPDGLGGFAMGTADGIRTRRYHAILLSASQPPEGRRVLVADVEVYVDTAAGRFALSSHRYHGDVVHPDGATHLAAFAWHPWPRWDYHLPDGTRVAYELVVAPGSPHVCLRWTKIAGTATNLHVRPFLAGRDYHSSHHANPVFRFDPEQRDEQVIWHPYPGVPSIAALSDGIYIHGGGWYRGFRYTEEAARGLDAEEDLASPGELEFDLGAGPAHLAFSANGWGDQTAAGYVDATFEAERTRRAAFSTQLVRAADAYICARGSGKTIIAGYPWFADWGRDTFISLRGLCLTTGRRDVAREILLEWVAAIDQGMLPNRYDEHQASPEFNSVDAALWFVIAADAYLAGPLGTVTAADRRVLEAGIDAIVAGYAAGTRHRIHADTDGLLACGEDGVQLTWMDARIDGECITPRIGKPVEIQALWINALAIAGRREPRWAELAARAKASFVTRFWDPERKQLHDVVDCDHVPGKFDAIVPAESDLRGRPPGRPRRRRHRPRGRRYRRAFSRHARGPAHVSAGRSALLRSLRRRPRRARSRLSQRAGVAVVDGRVRRRVDSRPRRSGRGSSPIRRAAARTHRDRRARPHLRDLRWRRAASPGRLSVPGVVGRRSVADQRTVNHMTV